MKQLCECGELKNLEKKKISVLKNLEEKKEDDGKEKKILNFYGNLFKPFYLDWKGKSWKEQSQIEEFKKVTSIWSLKSTLPKVAIEKKIGKNRKDKKKLKSKRKLKKKGKRFFFCFFFFI